MAHVLSEEQIEWLRGCSQYEQYYNGRKNFERGHCAFCDIDRDLNHVLYEQDKWVAWEVPQNFTTRKSTLALQLVFFPVRHLREPTNLSDAERVGYFKVIDWAYQKFDIPGGGIVNRIGDMRRNVGTIMHMHATIMVPNREGSVIVPLQKDIDMWRDHDSRMKKFARRYEAGEVPEDI